MSIKEGFYKVCQSDGSYVTATFFNPCTLEEYSECVRDYEYNDCSRDNDELYYMDIDKNAERAWRHYHKEILWGDEVKVVKGRKVPVGTIANVKEIRPYYDCYNRWICDYAYLDNGMKTNVNNLVLAQEVKMEKYSLWNNQDEMIFFCDDNTIFSTTIEVNYPLGDFVSVYDVPEWVTIVFENYKIVVCK